jgi:uncharacterized membrane-anchored protein YitT (DUF2179 family)
MSKIENRILKFLIKIILIFLASVVYAISVSLFLDPNDLAPGGITGLAIILNRIIPIETGTWILVLNIPIMILGLWKLGPKLILTTLYTLVIISQATNYFSQFPPITTEIIPAIIAGSVLCGGAIGVIFRCGSTTGGTDIVVKIMRLRFKHLKTGTLFFILDLFIVTGAGIMFQNFNLSIYALLAVLVINVALDAVLYGTDEAKMLFIISDHADVIAEQIMDDLDVGVTFLNGSGAYHRKQKNIILCVMRKQLSPKAEEIVKEVDPNAFMIVSSASEIFGEGYKNFFAAKL